MERLGGGGGGGGAPEGAPATEWVCLKNNEFTYLNSEAAGIAVTDWNTTAVYNSNATLFTPVVEGVTVSETGWYVVSYGILVEFPGSSGNIATRVLVTETLPHDPAADAVGPTASDDPWGGETMLQMPRVLVHANAGDTIGVAGFRVKSTSSTTCPAGKSTITISTV